MTVVEPGSNITARNAVTELRVLDIIGPFSLLECILQTGRTHQIRVHASFAGYPVVGDPLYGGFRRIGVDVLRGAAQAKLNDAVLLLKGQTLHAYYLAFNQPRSGERLEFEVPLHPEMQGLITLTRELLAAEEARL